MAAIEIRARSAVISVDVAAGKGHRVGHDAGDEVVQRVGTAPAGRSGMGVHGGDVELGVGSIRQRAMQVYSSGDTFAIGTRSAGSDQWEGL